MGPNHRPNAVNSRRSGFQTCTYLNGSYPYLPATPVPRDRLRSRPSRRSCAVAQGIHSAKNSLKYPSTGPFQPHHDTYHPPHYSYPPASLPQDYPSKQDKNGQTFVSTRTQRTREVSDHERQATVNYAPPAFISSPAKPAVAMTFVPEQPAKRAMTFESSLFQRNDSSTAPPQSYQRMPLSELIIPPNISSNRSMNTPLRSPLHGSSPCRERPPRRSVPRPPRRPCVQPPPSPLPPSPSPPSRRERPPSQQSSSRFIRPYPREEDEILPQAPLKHGRPSRVALPARPSRK